MGEKIGQVLAVCFGLLLIHNLAFADAKNLDYPHSAANGLGCPSCHYIEGLEAPAWLNSTGIGDDTASNNLCLSCHNEGYPTEIPVVANHSSLKTSNQYHQGEGGWFIECRSCHWVHHQRQLRTYGAAGYAYTGTSATVTATTLTVAGAPWANNQFDNYILIPNIANSSYNYQISATSTNTLTVNPAYGAIDLTKTSAGDMFAIFYGKLVGSREDNGTQSTLMTPYNGRQTVRLFARTGPNSFADGDGAIDGVCEVCHTETRHFRNTGEINVEVNGSSGYDHTEEVATNCIACHPHSGGFAHGGGAGGTGCGECHGHDLSTNFDPDMQAPYTPGPNVSSGAGTAQSHSTHTETDGEDAKGPEIYCDTCHDLAKMPRFKNLDGSGNHSLAETDICNNCHSGGGTYDGVSEAKANWSSSIYLVASGVQGKGPSSHVPKAGKEKWCVTCHDESPGDSKVDNTGVNAPNIAGDEDGAYTYGSGWGYYKTGHGLPAGDDYPASGGVTAGANVECSGCHDYAASHIDGLARTFDDGESENLDPSNYRQGYRLKLVAAGTGTGATGREPMLVPCPGNTANSANNYRLCMDCHDSGPFTDPNNPSTNLKTDGVNRHETHLRSIGFGKRVSADWSNSACTSGDMAQCNSRITCTTCHNVHGSTRLAMVRDGSLIGRTPGLKVWYDNPAIVDYASPPDIQPTPPDLPLTASTGTVWSAGSSSNLCSHCHGNTWLLNETRTPYQSGAQAPTLSWPGTAGYEADGVDPDTAGGGSNFTFRVTYADSNNDAPTVSQVWIDRDHDGYDDDKYDMTALDGGDVNYFDGKIYTLTMPISKHGSNVFDYRFSFAAGADVATGAPASADYQVAVTNNGPTLTWTAEENYVSDGVHPNTGGNGTSFTFRVQYTDLDGEGPDAGGIKVVINGTPYALDPEAGGSYSTGKIYAQTIVLSTAGNLSYHFTANDVAGAGATGGAATDHIVTVLESSNTPPVLAWTTGNCLSDGVRPRTGAINADFEFRVKYSDMDNECPSTIRVTVNGVPYDLTGNDGASCQTGRTYYRAIAVATAGDLAYSFSASDGTDTATGTPTANHTVSAVNTAYKVRPEGGAGWYSVLTDGYNATPAAGTLLVYPNADFTAATYAGGLSNINKTNRTLQSVCGPDLTVISGGGTQVVYLAGNDGAVIDGFSITGGGSYGIYSNSDSLTVKNSKIYSNPRGINLNNGCNPTSIQSTSIYSNTEYGIYSPSTLNLTTITDSSIYGNGGGATAGPAINFNGGAGTHTITNSIFTGNTTTGNGGAIYCNGCTVTIDDSTLNGNTAGAGGAIYLLNAATAAISDSYLQGNQATNAGALYVASGTGTANLTNVMLTGNEATTGSGGAIYVNGAANLLFTTVSGNYAGNLAGAIYHNSTGITTIKNSIIYNNDAANQPNYKQIYAAFGRWQYVDVYNTLINQVPGSGAATFSYEDLGGNNTAGDPHFADGQAPAPASTPTTVGDYRLQSGSPAINAASPSWTSDHDIFDPTPGSRPKGGAYDMGVHEKE